MKSYLLTYSLFLEASIMNVSNDINNSNNNNNGTVLHDSYQKNTSHNVEIRTDTFLLDGSDDDEVGTTTTTKKKTSWNRTKQILMVAGGSLLLVAAVLASHMILTATTTTEVKGASVRTNPLAALWEFGRSDTGLDYSKPYCAQLQWDTEWHGKNTGGFTSGLKYNLQSCFKVKGSDQHCWSNNVNVDLTFQDMGWYQ